MVAWLVPADGEFMRYHGTIQIRKTKGGEVGEGGIRERKVLESKPVGMNIPVDPLRFSRTARKG